MGYYHPAQYSSPFNPLRALLAILILIAATILLADARQRAVLRVGWHAPVQNLTMC